MDIYKNEHTYSNETKKRKSKRDFQTNSNFHFAEGNEPYFIYRSPWVNSPCDRQAKSENGQFKTTN